MFHLRAKKHAHSNCDDDAAAAAAADDDDGDDGCDSELCAGCDSNAYFWHQIAHHIQPKCLSHYGHRFRFQYGMNVNACVRVSTYGSVWVFVRVTFIAHFIEHKFVQVYIAWPKKWVGKRLKATLYT